MAAAPSASMVRIRLPCETLSPTLTFTSPTVPACGEGTSMVALSLSNVSSGSSTAIFWPALTWTSMIGMSLKSPMSGTLISTVIASLQGAGRPTAGHSSCGG
jgi:hypothetical protein